MENNFSIDTIHKMDLEKELKLQKCYNEILKKCHKEIKHAYCQKKNNILFKIPCNVSKTPDYDLYDSIVYIIQELRNGGFIVNYVEKNIITIAWENIQKTHSTAYNTNFLIDEFNQSDDEPEPEPKYMPKKQPKKKSVIYNKW